MTTTNVGAYQEICERVRYVVDGANMGAIVGYTPEVRYGDVNYPKTPAGDKLWMRVALINASEKRRTLSVPSRVTYSGLASIQLFVPQTDKDAANRIRRVAEELLKCFARSTANVDFYKGEIKDMPFDNPWFYKRVSATFQYSEMV